MFQPESFRDHAAGPLSAPLPTGGDIGLDIFGLGIALFASALINDALRLSVAFVQSSGRCEGDRSPGYRNISFARQRRIKQTGAAANQPILSAPPSG